MSCDSDVDCDGSKRCYNTSCQCDWTYGIRGPECNEMSGVTAILICIMTSTLLLSIVNVVIGIVILVRLKKRGRLKVKSASFSTLCFVTTGATLLIPFAILRIWTMAHGDEYSVRSGEKDDPFADETNSLSALSICCGLCAGLNVAILWLEVSIRSRKMQKTNTGNIQLFAKVVWGICTVFIVLVLSMMAARRQDLAAIVGVPFVILLLIMFRVAHFKLQSLFADSNLTGTTSNVRQQIRETTRNASVAITLSILCAIPFAVVSLVWENEDNAPEPGSYNIPTYAQFGTTFFLAVFMSTMAKYLWDQATPKQASSSVPEFATNSDKKSTDDLNIQVSKNSDKPMHKAPSSLEITASNAAG